MAHEIDFSNGRANMAYVGETPWHGLGFKLLPGMGIEEWTIAAGFEYEVLRAPVQYMNGEMHVYEGKDVLFRSDTHKPLGVVSDGYQIVQPAECLEFFRDLCADQGFALETAGCLKGGAVYWALAKTGHSLTINGNDETNGYVLMSTSADGSRATDCRFTAIRVVCNNTLSLAAGKRSKSAVKTRHSTAFCAESTKRKMGLSDHKEQWNSFMETMNKLTKKQVSDAAATEFFAKLLRPAKAAESEAPENERAVRGLVDLMQSYTTAPGAVPGTAYGLLQGVTHYVDHVRGNNDDKRLTSAWFGQGDALKTRAMEALVTL